MHLHKKCIIILISGLLLISTRRCHLVGDKAQVCSNFICWAGDIIVILLLSSYRSRSTSTELKKLCENAYTCFHDTVIICGKSVNEARTFLDLCDLYEYSCEYNMVYRHVKEEEGVCPNPKEIGRGVG